MGIYMMINDWDRENKRKVSDEDLNEIFQEALNLDPSLMISEFTFTKKRFFKTEKTTHYNLYHECSLANGLSAYEARQQLSACGNKNIVISYLYGLINGYHAAIRVKKKDKFGYDDPNGGHGV